jgi:hypothetical protein
MECTHMGSLMGKVGSLNARLRLLKCTQSAQFIGLFPPKIRFSSGMETAREPSQFPG